MAKALVTRTEPAVLHQGKIALVPEPRAAVQRRVIRHIVRNRHPQLVRRRLKIISRVYLGSIGLYTAALVAVLLLGAHWPIIVTGLWMAYVIGYNITMGAGQEYLKATPALLRELAFRHSEELRSVPFRVASCQLGDDGPMVELGTKQGNSALRAFLAANPSAPVILQVAQPWADDETTERVALYARNVRLSNMPVLHAAEVTFTAAWYSISYGDESGAAERKFGSDATIYLAGEPATV